MPRYIKGEAIVIAERDPVHQHNSSSKCNYDTPNGRQRLDLDGTHKAIYPAESIYRLFLRELSSQLFVIAVASQQKPAFTSDLHDGDIPAPTHWLGGKQDDAGGQSVWPIFSPKKHRHSKDKSYFWKHHYTLNRSRTIVFTPALSYK